ncbi:PIN domain-containing protein [Photobacterium kishitanii]|uniref:PIN-like domain-containing protein n=1 Tax=Photobacterium kishitanii TaxID=318456 RepID=A0A2T3KMH3_9GAMM|nr:PIN domain-containing protein [Photobacterium kishitanii]PSV00999.1 hypothetical protein C9J27_02945 [Photobacterium kishitanii]
MDSLKSSNSVGEYIVKSLFNSDLSEKNIYSLASKLDIGCDVLALLIKDDIDLTIDLALKFEVITEIPAEEWIRKGNEVSIQKHREKKGISRDKTAAITHFFIDGENVQPSDFDEVKDMDGTKVWFLGNINDRIKTTVFERFLMSNIDAEVINLTRRARNALDFHITYLLGKITAQQPRAKFYIISRDAGYDPLIKYISDDGFKIKRITTFSEVNTTKAKVSQERLKIKKITTFSEVNTTKAKVPQKIITKEMIDRATHEALKFIKISADYDTLPKTPAPLCKAIKSIESIKIPEMKVYGRLRKLGIITKNEDYTLKYNFARVNYHLQWAEQCAGTFALSEGIDSPRVVTNNTEQKVPVSKIKSRLDIMPSKYKTKQMLSQQS